MYRGDAEILFPARVIPVLRDSRGQAWQELVEQVGGQPEDSLDVLAFSLLMIRLAGCLTCQPHSYRAMQGCTTCARQTIARFKGTDAELLAKFRQARHDVECHFDNGGEPGESA